MTATGIPYMYNGKFPSFPHSAKTLPFTTIVMLLFMYYLGNSLVKLDSVKQRFSSQGRDLGFMAFTFTQSSVYKANSNISIFPVSHYCHGYISHFPIFC